MHLDVAKDEDGNIIDYISGERVKGTPEELHATQVFSMELVQSFGFRKEQIVTRPQFRVSARPSDEDSPDRIKTDGYPTDIAVFDDVMNPDKQSLFALEKSADDLRIVVECKAPDKKEGRKQLQRYLSLSSAEIGVWFNGNDRLIIQKVFNQANGGRPEYKEIPSLPRRGQAVAAIGHHKKSDLHKAHNLKNILVRLRNHIAGNSVGTTRDEAIASEIINVIFCKIHDEKTKGDSDVVEFRAQVGDTAKQVAARIKSLFKSMKESYKAVFSEGDKINLDDASVLYVVGELQQYGLLQTERDIVADAFEVFIGPSLKGSQGQFFTPRNAVALAIQLLDISENDRVIDPACGSGGFLVETLARKWALVDNKRDELKWSESTWATERNRVAAETIFGIEKDSFLAKVAKAYMAIMGDGRGGIFCENTLARPETWKAASRLGIWGEDPDIDGDGLFDVVVANPPYGEDIRISDPKDLAQYNIVSSGGVPSKKGVRPDILFIERCLQLLKPGGRMGIVLIETFFHAPDSKPVLDLMRNGNNISWVVDLPHNTFRPHCNAKTVIVVIEKGAKQQERINFAVAHNMGHDHRGEPLFRRDASGKKTPHLWDDLAEISLDILEKKLTNRMHGTSDKKAKEKLASEINGIVARKRCPTPLTFSASETSVRSSGVYVPRFHWADAEAEIRKEALASQNSASPFTLVSIGDLLAEGSIISFDGHGSPSSYYKGTGTLPYIRVDDIAGWSLYKNPVSGVPQELYGSMVEMPYLKAVEQWQKNVADAAAGKKSTRKTPIVEPIDKRPKAKDILFVRRGSYRIGSVAIISPADGEMVLTRELLTLRVKAGNPRALTPEYLLFALAHPLVQRQLPNKVLIDTTMPNIGDRWKTLLLPIYETAERQKIESQILEALEKRWEGESLIAEISKQHGKLVM